MSDEIVKWTDAKNIMKWDQAYLSRWKKGRDITLPLLDAEIERQEKALAERIAIVKGRRGRFAIYMKEKQS